MKAGKLKGHVIVMVFVWSRGIDLAQSQHYPGPGCSKAD